MDNGILILAICVLKCIIFKSINSKKQSAAAPVNHQLTELLQQKQSIELTIESLNNPSTYSKYAKAER